MTLTAQSFDLARASDASLPAAIFREADIEKITGFSLEGLKSAVTTFLEKAREQPGVPGTDSLAGVWIFGLADRNEGGGGYVSTTELAKTLRSRAQTPTEKFFYRDVQFVWDLKKLHLGRWTFWLNGDREVRVVVSGFIKQADGKEKPVNVWVVVDASGGYAVRDWGIDENPIH